MANGNLYTFDPQTPSAIIKEELELLAMRIQANLASTGTNASGRTSKSLHVEMDNDGGRLMGRGFFSTTETGRNKGGAPGGFYYIIRQWMKDKGVHADDGNDNRMAYFISRKIPREGSKLFRDGGRADIYSNEIPKTIEAISERILGIILKQFTTDLNMRGNQI